MSTVFAIQLLDPLSAILMETAVTTAIIANISIKSNGLWRFMSYPFSDTVTNLLTSKRALY
jgi:hypothetical protein